MKQLSRLCAGVILALSLALSTYAGHIPCPGITDEPSTTTQATEETATGEIPNGVESIDPITGLLLSLIVDILPLI